MQRREPTPIRAFTLIELLVVIAIIAILAAILFPVFAQAKLAAKKTSDLAQIKQIGTGIHIYLADVDDVYPLATVAHYNYGGGWNDHVRWSSNEVVGPYVKNGPIFKSPGDSATIGALPSWMSAYPQMSGANAGKVYVNSYFANAMIIGPNNADSYAFDPAEAAPKAQAGLFGPGPANTQTLESYGAGYPAIGSATSATAVQFPSELIMLVDGASDMDAYWNAYNGNTACGNTTNTQMYYCTDDFEETWRALWFAVNYYNVAPKPDRVLREYNGSANYVMADSSARSLKPGAVVKGNLYLNQHRWVVNPGQ